MWPYAEWFIILERQGCILFSLQEVSDLHWIENFVLNTTIMTVLVPWRYEGSQMTKELENLLFLMCVVTNERSRDLFLAECMILLSIITVFAFLLAIILIKV